MPLRTVGKVGRVLDLFSFERAEWGVREAAEALDLPKSGAHALMSSLAGQGLLRRTRGGRYRLGWRLTAMNQVLLGTTDFRHEARRAMEHLASRFGGESFYLAVLEGERVIYLDEVRDYRMAESAASPLDLPVEESAVGKVLLAGLAWADVLEVVASGTPAELGWLRDELRDVRERGYANDTDETVRGSCHAAAPIHDRTGDVVAAIGIEAPTHRFHWGRERYLTILTGACRGVSESIGYTYGGMATGEPSANRGGVRHQTMC